MPYFNSDRIEKKIIKIIKDYSLATGSNCFVIDNKGMEIFYEHALHNQCQLCSFLADEKKHYPDHCRYSHLYGGYQAERFGGSYIYFCPLSLLFWASPIMIDGMKEFTLIGGPALLIAADEYLTEEVLLKHKIVDHKQAIIKEHIHSLPYIETQKASSLAELLKSIAISLSKEQEVSLEQKKILLQQQSRISEYIQYIKENKDQPMQVTSYPLKKEQELIQYISKGQKAEAQRLLNEILGYVFFASGQDFSVIKLRTLELLVLLSRAAINGGADVEEIFGLNYKYINLLDNFKTIEELTFWLSKIMFRFTDLVFDLKEAKHADLIHKALRYIQSNYQGKITLEEVATLVNLSPSYFSKVFKEGMNCSFTSYLNRYRIDQSKLLLKTTAIPLSEIGALVGFEDQSYFTKIFKKNTGMLPGKYRRSNLSIFQNTPEIRN